jgi:hypothetical protein
MQLPRMVRSQQYDCLDTWYELANDEKTGSFPI